MKFCKDCKYNTRLWCKSPSNGTDLVSGENSIRFCTVNRSHTPLFIKNQCGPEGLYFEPKEEVKSRGFIAEFFSRYFKEKV